MHTQAPQCLLDRTLLPMATTLSQAIQETPGTHPCPPHHQSAPPLVSWNDLSQMQQMTSVLRAPRCPRDPVRTLEHVHGALHQLPVH